MPRSTYPVQAAETERVGSEHASRHSTPGQERAVIFVAPRWDMRYIRCGDRAYSCPVMLGTLTDDADAARRTQLKTPWAVVNSDGTLNRGKGVTSISKPSTGEYEIKFKQDVDRCAYSATFDRTTGFISISLRDTSVGPREVGVATTDRSAVVRDSPFHLTVQC